MLKYVATWNNNIKQKLLLKSIATIAIKFHFLYQHKYTWNIIIIMKQHSLQTNTLKAIIKSVFWTSIKTLTYLQNIVQRGISNLRILVFITWFILTRLSILHMNDTCVYNSRNIKCLFLCSCTHISWTSCLLLLQMNRTFFLLCDQFSE